MNKENIIEWAMYEASYSELKDTATALYKIYATEREKNHPDEQLKAKEMSLTLHYAQIKKDKEIKAGITHSYTTPKPIKRKSAKWRKRYITNNSN